ncbi:uncharacterized protein LOC119072732 [Bradysia coprophila]|uniref:uncharacterized protein LOC119072732 n=1 Tax=Bradysia coprophila TaxID=38358 RepID=UPI00187DB747|nr:uncharacterized protein LOC119072732 [Bradysia coprophila]
MGIIRFVILAAMGLGSLWMVHLLAQDFNKFRPSVPKALNFLRSKRDLNAVSYEMDTIENFDVNWPKILEFDPLKCALSLICELTSGAEKENPEASNIKAVVQYSIVRGAPDEVDKAYQFGARNPNLFSKCREEYPFCPYSAKVMLKLLDLHNTVFGTSSDRRG